MSNGQKYENRPETRDAFHVRRDIWTRRFWSKVDVRGEEDCWPWLGRVTPYGYGSFKLGKSAHHASRVSLALKIGRWPEKEEFACHACDNPSCCNPSHIWLGTSRENTLDAAAKGRLHRWNGTRAGEGSPNAKLTEAEVLKIISAKGQVPLKQICSLYGVTSGAVGAIWSGRSWRHLPRPEPRHD